MKPVFLALLMVPALSLCLFTGCTARLPEPAPGPSHTPTVAVPVSTAASPISAAPSPAKPVPPATPAPPSVTKTGEFTPDGLRLTGSFAPEGMALAKANLMSDGTFAREFTTASGLVIREERRLPGIVTDKDIVNALQTGADKPSDINLRECPGLSARLTYPVWLAEYQANGGEGAQSCLSAFVGTDDWSLVYTLAYPAGSDECALLADRWIALICLKEPQDEPDPVLEAPIDTELEAVLDSAANAAVVTKTQMFVRGGQPDGFAVAYVHDLLKGWLPDRAGIPVTNQSVVLKESELDLLFGLCFDEGRMPSEQAWKASEGVAWKDGVVTFAAENPGAARFEPEMSRFTPEGDVWVHGTIMLGDKNHGTGAFTLRPTGASAAPLLYRLSSLELD